MFEEFVLGVFNIVGPKSTETVQKHASPRKVVTKHFRSQNLNFLEMKPYPIREAHPNESQQSERPPVISWNFSADSSPRSHLDS